MKKRMLCLLFCVLFLTNGAITTFAIPPTFIGPYEIELEDGLLLYMSSIWGSPFPDEDVKVSGLYRDGQLIYEITTFIPQDDLVFVSPDGMHLVAFWHNWHDHWMLADHLDEDGNIGTVEIYYMGNLIYAYEVAGLRFEPSNSRWHRTNDSRLHIVTTGVLHRMEIVINLSDFSILSEQDHFDIERIRRGKVIVNRSWRVFE